MAKGRRERDRPKAVPGALYNPNKRVKLSYDSDDEGEEEVPQLAPVRYGPEAPVKQTGQIGAGANEKKRKIEDEEAEVGQGEGNAEDDVQQCEDEERDDEVEDAGVGRKASRLVNETTGQWHALGSIAWQNDDGGDEDARGSPDPAMQYLRSVRAERHKLPAVLHRAGVQPPKRKEKKNTYNGFDVGDAIIAPPMPQPQQQDRSDDPREAFTNALKARFFRQRQQLSLPPTSDAIAALDDKHPISFPPSTESARLEWLKLLVSTPPAPAQLRALEQDTVTKLLELIQECHLVRQTDVAKVTSTWIFSLLARLDDVGTMDRDQVYAVRAFGKKAVLVQVSFRSAEIAARLEGIANAEAGAAQVKKSTNHEIAGEDKTKQASDNESKAAARENTLATLDSILVIVGDVFRQRDLLEFRQPWEMDTAATTGD